MESFTSPSLSPSAAGSGLNVKRQLGSVKEKKSALEL